MKSQRVLSVGQCAPDNMSLRSFLTETFDVSWDTADSKSQAIEMSKAEEYALVLVNRKLDADYSEGMEVLKAIKTAEETAETPVMIVSNFEDAQKTAVGVGAEYGFGKNEIGNDEVVDRLKPYLGEPKK
ncbi:response regulator [Stratiformator vulcanicus]|uniref:Response regulator receiver domain protein n=1 Tax=Stratiformator vulcanicus TaxID=2527980 RepID=A0A517R5B6_9PLAN|nr:response regulator [Stratiformator vulcanicus]QDT39087.1 Response regulator receiver domain protein [Stratiformator vulcanicus]